MRFFIAAAAFLAFSSTLTAGTSPRVLAHDISISIDPENHALKGSDRMTLEKGEGTGGRTVEFLLHTGLKVLRALARGRELTVSEVPLSDRGAARKVNVELPGGEPVTELTLEYEGKIHDPVRKSRAMGFVRGDDTSGIISEKGVFLHAGTHWYPRGSEAHARFRMEVRLPEAWWDVTEGDLVRREVVGGTRASTWESKIPLDGPSLVANRFTVKSKIFDGVTISAYFTPRSARLTDDYIEAGGKYLKFYRELLGAYPFTRFDIVENFFTTGYGMPGFTLLGPQVIQMAHFGSRTLGPHSLGHELVHCWWGNSVYVPRGGGNWCEAMTTYCANYLWVEKFDGAEKARDYRRKAFLRYSIFVDETNDYPVRKFAYKRREVDDFIGYTKGSMVLHTLRGVIGDKAFFGGLRSVAADFSGKVASWDDFRRAFEGASGRELKGFFDQWIDGKGAPSLSLEGIRVEREGEEWVVHGQLRQSGGPFRLAVPVVVTTERGPVREVFEFAADRTRIALRTKAKPIRVEADPDFHVFRRLHPGEIHPCLELTLSHDTAVVVYPTGGTAGENAFYKGLADRYAMSSRRIPAKADRELSEEDLTGRSLLVLGGPKINEVSASLASRLHKEPFEMGKKDFSVTGTRYAHEGQSALVSVVHPANPDRHVTFYVALSPKGMNRARLMAHYGWESYLVYDARKPRQVLSRGNFAPAYNPCAANLGEGEGGIFEDTAFGPGEALIHRYADDKRLDFRQFMDALSDYDVVFVGEYHNDWATHHAEYGILAGLSSLRGSGLAVSMEMFERDVQKVLDDYLAGRIPETEMLMKSRPWGNYRVGYREIVEFAKAKGYPVIAANIPRRLASSLARKGMEALDELSDEDRAYVARETSAPEGPYKKKFLRTMLGGREGPSNPMIERIYASQCLKDDTMAESIVDFLDEAGRERSLVVHYNGSFHSDEHLGTVERVEKRLPGKKVAVVKIVSDRDLLSADVEAYRGDADFLMVCRKRGEDLMDGAYALNISRRVRFLPVVPRDLDPAGDPKAVVVFHRRGGAPADLRPVLQAWGATRNVVLLPEGTRAIWNRDGTPGYGWFGPARGSEEGDVLATFGSELRSLLRNAYGVKPERTSFIGFGEGARAAAICASGFGAGKKIRLVAVNADPASVVGSIRGPASVTLVNPRGRAGRSRGDVRVETVKLEQGPAAFTDAVGRAVAGALRFTAPPEAPFDRNRTLVLSLSNRSPHARRWAYKIQMSLERALKARVLLYTAPGGKVSLSDVFLALHLKGVKRILHQPLSFTAEGKPALEFPQWAAGAVEGKIRHLPPLTWEEVLRPEAFPPKPRSRMAPQLRFVVLPGKEEGAIGAEALAELVKKSKLKNVTIVDTERDPSALKTALQSRRGSGMASMMARQTKTYIVTAAFASGEPAAFLPALYRHGDENLHIRAGFGCLNLAKVIQKRLEEGE
ncbi:MAG: ChaN family lipoprotein [Planctomycetota bacterium]|jgi:uncharacterized iron-regulated protein